MRNDALNAVCPYYTMYPLDFPLSVLKKHGKRGDWVLDPFCGRGTTNFAARLLEMPSVGVDSSPVAHSRSSSRISGAKIKVLCIMAIVQCGLGAREGASASLKARASWSRL